MKNIFKELRPGKGNKSESHDFPPDSPEANVARAIKSFCEAGKGQEATPAPGPEGIDSTTNMDEVTFLPVIVDYAESSPTAAKEALYTIRKQLDMKNAKQGYQQYNALMLLRILVDNPGPTFTRNFDAKFVSAVKELYRGARDPSVRQLLVENLEYFERKDDPGLQPIKEWYVKEKKGGDFGLRQYVKQPPVANVGGYPVHAGQPYSGRSSRRPKNVLPPPEELAARISEAQTSAKLLMQILQSTPTAEVLANQLITEFADRCSAASRSIQQFIEADQPAPDESTMLTLFETNEQLATSLSRHQMAIFSAKQQLKQQGGGTESNPTSRTPSGNVVPTLSTPIPPLLQSPSPPHQGAIGSPPHETVNYRTSPSPPVPQQRSLFAPPPPPIPPAPISQPQSQPAAMHGAAQPENPFNDPEPQRYQQPSGFNTAPFSNWRQEQPQGFGQPSPITPGQQGEYGQQQQQQQPGGGHHPMADVSPVAPREPQSQVPHGYQPYRY